VFVVASPGNDATYARQYPAADRNALSVGATDGSVQRASFSNYGSSVDLAAPGTEILTTLPRYATVDWGDTG
jgi:subtilisin family serine protease